MIRRIIWEIEAIEDIKRNENRDGFIKGYWKGTGDTEKCLSITYPCARCGEPVAIHLNDNAHRAIVGFLKANGWGHRVCPQKFYYPPPQPYYFPPY